jgi:hypothetical protein
VIWFFVSIFFCSRPARLSDVVSHEHVLTFLKGALQAGNVILFFLRKDGMFICLGVCVCVCVCVNDRYLICYCMDHPGPGNPLPVVLFVKKHLPQGKPIPGQNTFLKSMLLKTVALT